MAGDVPDQYLKDFQYLQGKSNNGTLDNKNNIYQKLEEKAKNLPGLKRALSTLSVTYR